MQAGDRILQTVLTCWTDRCAGPENSAWAAWSDGERVLADTEASHDVAQHASCTAARNRTAPKHLTACASQRSLDGQLRPRKHSVDNGTRTGAITRPGAVNAQ